MIARTILSLAAHRPKLYTTRLVLRRPRADDLRAIIDICSDWEVASRLARLPWPYGPEEARYFLEEVVPAELVWVICWKATGEVLGAAGLTPDSAFDVAELGYYLGQRWWGCGIATEAAAALVDHGFQVLRLSRLTSGYFIDNPASGRVLTKLGFEEVGRGTRPCLAAGCDKDAAEMLLVRRAGRTGSSDVRPAPLLR